MVFLVLIGLVAMITVATNGKIGVIVHDIIH